VNEKGWKRVATVAADYSFGYTNFLGFAVDFCRAGGDIVERFWVPLGSSDFGGVIARCPTTSMPSISASAAPTPSTSSTSTNRPAPRPT
jgi:hypothetical protein